MAQMITGGATIDAQRSSRTRHLAAWGGTNDIALSGASGATVYGRIVTYGTARKSAGWPVVIILGILPRQTGGAFETARASVNASLRADFPTATAFANVYTGSPGYGDIFIDVEGDADIGQDGDQNNTAFFDPDTIHLKNAGYAKIATYVFQALSLIP